MKEIKRDNAGINYQIRGSGDTTLLFVHGSNIDQTYWAAQVNYFSSQYKVVTLDLPGHGNSHFPMLENPEVLNKLLEKTIHKIIKNAL